MFLILCLPIDIYVYTYIDIYGTTGQKVPFVPLTNVPLTGPDFCPVNKRPVNECPVNGDIVYSIDNYQIIWYA